MNTIKIGGYNIMESQKWVKNKKPYLIFKCAKCSRFLYIIASQKTKKCFQCGYNHKVKTIRNIEETVLGLTKAIDTVKQKQNELAIKQLGMNPDLRTTNDFCVSNEYDIESVVLSNKKLEKNEDKLDYSGSFKNLLDKIAKKYHNFPYYMITLLNETEYKIPVEELKLLIKKFTREKKIIKLKNNYFTLRKE
jgi:hypothetical protein